MEETVKVVDLELLKAVIDGSGQSRWSFAEGIGITPGYLSLMLNGRRNMSVAILNQLAEQGGLDLSKALIEK